MKVYDVSAPIFEGMAVYKNKPEKQPEIFTSTNAHVTESRIKMDLHCGTHIDAPLHMDNDGLTIDTIPLEKLVRSCKVFDLTTVDDRITKQDLESLNIQKDDFVLFKTKNSFEEEFNFEFVFLAEDGAKHLAEIGVQGIGIDALGVERSQPGHPTHKTLFSHEIIVIEGLRLKDIKQGEYFMVAAPLKLVGVDAAPARILLIDNATF